MRAAMDLHDQRVFLCCIETRRLDDPAVHLRAASRCEAHVFDVAESYAGEQVVVDVSELDDIGGPPAPRHPDSDDIIGRLRSRTQSHRTSASNHSQRSEHVNATGYGARRTGERSEVHIRGTVILNGEVEATAIVGPENVADVAIE